jgi:hypothetical protein
MGGHDNVSPVPCPYRNPSPPPPPVSSEQQQQLSSASSIADVLEPIEQPSPTPSSSAQEPIRLTYQRATATAGPTYALQISASLRQQPLRERLVLSDRLREALILPAEEDTLGARRHPSRPSPPPPPPPPQTESDVQTDAASARFCDYRDGCQCERCTE